jgi:hypothetical protein
MTTDEARIAGALRKAFGRRATDDDARDILGMLNRKENRMALIQKLANVQMHACSTTNHGACASLADKLLEAPVRVHRT